ncbi:TetR/AcrR family transcriptional regulator [Desulfovibrio caledoniensis]
MATLKAVPKVIPIRNKEITKEKLVKAVGKVLAKVGFQRLGVNMIAREAGVDKKLIYRYYQGLEGLVAEYGRTVEFWPTAEELLGEDAERIRAMSPAELMSQFFRRYMRAILRRPQTLEILAWEGVVRNDLTRALEEVRVKTALEFFELMQTDPPEEVDLTALVMILAASVNFLAVRSRMHRSLGGIDLQSEAGWKRIEDTLDLMLTRTLKQ